MHSLGFNYRMSDINCALGLSQLKKLDAFVTRRREIAGLYEKGLAGIRHLILPVTDLKPSASIPSSVAATHAFHLYPVQIDFTALGKTRTQVMVELRDKGVGTQVHYIPVCLQPYYREHLGLSCGQFPAAEHFFAQELSIPMFPAMTDDQVNHVIASVKSVLSARP